MDMLEAIAEEMVRQQPPEVIAASNYLAENAELAYRFGDDVERRGKMFVWAKAFLA